MASLKIVILDQTGGKKTPAELPDDVLVQRIIPTLVSKMGLPATNPLDGPLMYALENAHTGKRLGKNDTLKSADVSSGDCLKLLPKITAGSEIHLRRLQADYEKITELISGSDIVRIVRTEGEPPELYVIRFVCRSVKNLNSSNQPVYSFEHDVAIYLEADYPRKKPQLKWLTPIFHPNIHPNGAVCIGDEKDNYGWWPGRPLDDLIFYLGEMAQYKIYNPKSAYNGDAAQWCESYKSLLPTDNRSLRGPQIEITFTDSSNSKDDDVLGKIHIGD